MKLKLLVASFIALSWAFLMVTQLSRIQTVQANTPATYPITYPVTFPRPITKISGRIIPLRIPGSTTVFDMTKVKVILVDSKLNQTIVTPDAYGNFSFDVKPGEYKVRAKSTSNVTFVPEFIRINARIAPVTNLVFIAVFY